MGIVIVSPPVHNSNMRSTTDVNELSDLGGRDPLDALTSAVDALLAVNVSGLSDLVLVDQILRLRRVIDRAEAGFAELAVIAQGRGPGAIHGGTR